jgi:hypothetical protein
MVAEQTIVDVHGESMMDGDGGDADYSVLSFAVFTKAFSDVTSFLFADKNEDGKLNATELANILFPSLHHAVADIMLTVAGEKKTASGMVLAKGMAVGMEECRLNQEYIGQVIQSRLTQQKVVKEKSEGEKAKQKAEQEEKARGARQREKQRKKWEAELTEANQAWQCEQAQPVQIVENKDYVNVNPVPRVKRATRKWTKEDGEAFAKSVNYAVLVAEIYSKYDKEQLADSDFIEMTMAKYKGKEVELLSGLKKQYNIKDEVSAQEEDLL